MSRAYPVAFGRHLQAAERVASACGHESVNYLPPAYAALNLPSCLTIAAQMYEWLEPAERATCVACWRAWYDLPLNYEFEELPLGRQSLPTPWFSVSESVVTGARKRGAANQWRLGGAASAEEACRYVSANCPPAECKAITDRLVCTERKRTIAR